MSDPLNSSKFDPSTCSEVLIDTGLLISYLMNENQIITDWFDKFIFTDERSIAVVCNILNLTELFYVTCRKKGKEKAAEVVEQIKQFILCYEDEEINNLAGVIKCQFSISIVDCFSIATAKWLNCPVLFKKEKEMPEDLISEIKQKCHPKLWVVSYQDDHIIVK